MKRLTALLTLLGCITLCSYAWNNYDIPYDRNFNVRSGEFTSNTVVPADSTLTTVFDGIEMSAMDYAEIRIVHGPWYGPYENPKQANYYIVGFGPSPRLKNLDKTSTERQKLIISDNSFYIANFGKKLDYNNIGPGTIKSIVERPKVVPDHHRTYYLNGPYCLADSLTFDFDLSEYACDFDVYFLLMSYGSIFDDAFGKFKFSDNIKSVNIYLPHVREIGHNAFSTIRNIKKVDVRLGSYWSMVDYICELYKVMDTSHNIVVYSDSFSQETYDTSLLETYASESEINEFQTNPSADNYSNNIYRFFKNLHTGVEIISIDECPIGYTIQDRTIEFTNLSPQQPVSIYTISGACVGNYVADNYGILNIEVDQSGLYLIRVKNTCHKVTIY